MLLMLGEGAALGEGTEEKKMNESGLGRSRWVGTDVP
jgi:hypothetical protein